MLVDRLSSRAGVLGCWPVLGRLCLRGEKEGPSFPFSVFQEVGPCSPPRTALPARPEVWG